jgi:hypothetical protein
VTANQIKMKNKILLLLLICLFSINGYTQKFYLGDKLYPTAKKFKLLGISSQTKLATYKYIGPITDKNFYNRKIGEIIVGVKNNSIVTTIYNLIPEPKDIGVPNTILDLIESALNLPLTYKNGIYAVSIDNVNISISRTKNQLTFYNDRIMIFTSVKNSILKN